MGCLTTLATGMGPGTGRAAPARSWAGRCPSSPPASPPRAGAGHGGHAAAGAEAARDWVIGALDLISGLAEGLGPGVGAAGSG